MKDQKIELKVQYNEEDDPFRPGTNHERRPNEVRLYVQADKKTIEKLEKAIRGVLFEVVSE